MKKKLLATVSSMLFITLLFSVPSATADVYVPPGPPHSKAAWISPTLFVFDMQDQMPIGWVYSDGDMYVATSSLTPIITALGYSLPGQTYLDKIHKMFPVVPFGIDRTVIPFSSYVMVLGFIPGVVVAPDQVPPPVEIVITWNGVPYVVTLTRDEEVGYLYPPEFPDDKVVPYAFTYPYDPDAPWKDAYYNIWVGDPNDIDPTEPEDLPFGYYFYYIFHPNAGDWIAWNCEGETKHPPTYDITALFEYSTSQIWFNHVCFDVEFLHVHRTVDWAALPWPMGNEIVDQLQITNFGKVNATQLDVWINIPSCKKVFLAPDWDTLTVSVTGDRRFSVPLDPITTGFKFGAPFDMPRDYMGEDLGILYPGETMTIYLEHNLVNPDPPALEEYPWTGTLVFDSMVSAWEIPPWKYPRAMHSLVVGTGPFTGIEYLWAGWKLMPIGYPDYDQMGMYMFTFIYEWPVVTPICRCPLPPQGTPEMILDPEPVDLNGDGVIDAKDITLVRQAIVGLIPYDINMDVNANSKIDTHDLARYKLAAD